jgi:hypothetical protein
LGVYVIAFVTAINIGLAVGVFVSATVFIFVGFGAALPNQHPNTNGYDS